MAVIKVSTVEIVKANAKIIINKEMYFVFSFNKSVKNPKSGIIFEFIEMATKPENPIKKTIGIIIKKETKRLFYKVS